MELKPIDLTFILIIAFSVITPAVSVCEDGWYEYYNTCFYISDARYNMHDLQHVCTAKNASLWTFHNETERQWVMKILEQGPRILYWTNLQLVNRHWIWGNSSVTYNKNNVHWYQNKEGSLTSSSKCAAMLSYPPYVGQLQQKRCTDGWGTICTRPNTMLDFCDISNGWHYIDGFCLKWFDTRKTWRDARQMCQQNQGDLTMYKSYVELTNLYNLVPCRTQNNILWIGLSDTVQPRTWRWVNNDTVRYSRWYPYSNRIVTNGSTCAASDPINSWQWRHYDCNDVHPFVCNRSLGVCPSGWLPFKDRCYQPNVVPASQKTWFDAKTYCESMGTELLQIDSDTKQQFINATIGTLQVSQAWLGFSDITSSDQLSWINGQSATDIKQYQRWDTNFPKPNPKRFDCGIITRGSRDSRWSNGYCYNYNSFFCEMIVTLQPLAPTPSPATGHCDKNWQLHGNSCYYFGPTPGQSLKTWGDANDFCKAAMGNLVIMNDPYEISYITVQQAKDKTSWIGLKYNTQAQQLQWVDGTSPGQNNIQETNFYPGEPDDITHGQLCIQIVGGRRDYTGSWDDGNCTVPKAFICEKTAYPGSSQLPTTPPVPNSWAMQCGPQWVYDSSENYCYQVVLNNPSTWVAARSDCQARGGDLLSISGRTEQNFVQAMLSTGKYASIQINFWIGATDQSTEGGWKWTDNSPFRYLNWHHGEPNNHVTGTVPEDCAEMVPAWNYQWNDKYCSKQQLYICKKPASVTSAPTLVAPTGVAAMRNCPGVPMMSGNYSLVADSVFKASSSRDARHDQTASRWYTGSTGAWSASTMDMKQWIQATFFNTIVVKGFVTAGRSDMDEWVSSYRIQYKPTFYSDWSDYMDPPGTIKNFTGNTDSQNPVTNKLLFPFEAKIVRLLPTNWQSGISLRWEILGCIEESCTSDYAISGPLIVPDSAIQASSIYDIAHDKTSARMKSVTPGVVPSCWKPQTDDTNQWISVDLGSMFVVRGVTTKGNPTSQQWVTSYRFQFSTKTDGSSFQYYQEPYLIPKTIPGNTDNTSPVTYMFKSHFLARFVKIIPKTWSRSIALSFDVLVCPYNCDTVPLVTGSVPISDDSLRASSMVDTRHSAFRARLNQPAGGGYGGAWRPLFNDKNQFLQVDLGYSVQIAAVATQGSFDSQDFTKTFTLSYSNDGASYTKYFELQPTPKVFSANWDQNSVRKNFMLIPFIARYVRLWPQAWNNNIALRVELYGCPGPESGTKIGCYADNIHQRDLPYEPYTDPQAGMWPPMCISHCFRKGFYYAGIQDQFKCFCGNTYGRYGPATDCSMSCVPKKNFFCGGPSSSVVYTTGLSSRFKVCPNLWKSYKDRCYLVLTDMKPWLEARAGCKRLGGDLASPNSQQEQDFVYSLMTLTNGTNVWIGFNDRQNENVYQWSDGRQVMYTAWGLNQPSHILNANQDCVIMMANATGSWSDAPCRSTNRYVCQVDKRPSIEPSVTTPVQGCPSGWSAYRWGCYLVADAKRTWAASRTACQTFKSSLVTVLDRYEQSYLSSILGSRSGDYWTDVTDTRVPGTFQYADLNAGLAFTNWAQNKPDATSQCVSMGGGSQAGLWFNHNCTDLRGMVCKQTRIGYTTPVVPSAAPVLTPCDNGTIQTPRYCYQVNTRPGSLRLSWTEAQNDCASKGGNLASFHSGADKDSLEVNTRPGNLRLSWTEAQNDCASKGGNLASFHSPADIDTVWRQALVGNSGGFWIGLNDRSTENGYVWSDGSVSSVFNWDKGQPDNYMNREDCVEMSPTSSKWNDDYCQLGRNWICMVNRGSSFSTPPTVNIPTAGSKTACDPSGNWTLYNGQCYYMSDGQGDAGRSWRQARTFCQQNNADLASIASATEQMFVYLTLAKNTSSYLLWLGFSELDSTRGYRWSDGSPVTFTNWDKNEPNDNGGQEDCVVMLIRDGKWLDYQCSSKFGFVCKRPLHATTGPTGATPPTPGNCPSGFLPLGARCYKIFTKAANWTTALNNCHKLGNGFSLASVRSDVENAFLTSQLADMMVSPWVGLKKDYRNQLQWINNDDVTYTNFGYGEPNGGGKEKCVQIMINSRQAGMWNDNACSTLQGYICQTIKNTAIPTQEPVPSLCDRRQNQQQFINNCYYFTKTAMTWNNSNNNCMKTGGYLASINSVFEQSFVYYLISQPGNGVSWIGLNDRKTPGIYSWSDSWPVQYTNWGAGQPVQGPTGGCVMLNATGTWQVADCSKPLYSLCKISRAVPSLTPPPPNGSCDNGWYPYQNRCYYMGAVRQVTVLDGTLFCRQHQANLVTVHNQTVNQFLVRTMTSLNPKSTSFWTSLHKSLNSGFLWVDGSPVQYTNWRKGEPSTHGWAGNQENCAEVFLSDGKWNDEDCSSQRSFICEKPLAVDTAVSGGWHNPTPIPRTPPVSLPPQVVPTLPTKKGGGNQPPGWSSLTVPPTGPGGGQITGASVLPTIHIHPYTGKYTNQSQQTGPVSTQILGMTPGSLAGVIIGFILIILVAILVLMYWRRRTTQGQQARFGLADQGFENKTYMYNKEREQVTEERGENSNGGGGSTMQLRSMSESSS